METTKIEGLEIKAIKGEGITAYIRATLTQLPEGEAIYMADLAKEVMAKFPTVKDRTQAYSRVVTVVNKMGLPRFNGVGKMTMVGRPKKVLTQVEAEAIEFGL